MNFGIEPATAIAISKLDSENGVLADFHSSFTAGHEPGISARQNLETMAMCEMMIRSLQQRTVKREELDEFSS